MTFHETYYTRKKKRINYWKMKKERTAHHDRLHDCSSLASVCAALWEFPPLLWSAKRIIKTGIKKSSIKEMNWIRRTKYPKHAVNIQLLKLYAEGEKKERHREREREREREKGRETEKERDFKYLLSVGVSLQSTVSLLTLALPVQIPDHFGYGGGLLAIDASRICQ